MQIEIVFEIAAHAPQPVGRAVVEVALLGGLAGIETTAQQIGKIEVGRIGGAGAGAPGEANPQIKIGREGRLRDVDSRHLVEVHAGIDDLLPPRETAVAEVEHAAGRDLGAGRVDHRHKLDGSGFEQRAVESADPGRLLPSTFRCEPKRPGQARHRMRRAVE